MIEMKEKMNYQAFESVVIEEIKSRNIQVDIELVRIFRSQGGVEEGLKLIGSGGLESIVNVEEMYRHYKSGSGIKEMVTTALKKIEDEELDKEFGGYFAEKEEMEWESVKDKVIFCLTGEETNRERKADIPARQEMDMLITYRIIFDEGEKESVQIAKELQQQLGVTEEELYQKAMKNMQHSFPVKLKTMDDVMEEIEGIMGESKSKTFDNSLQNIDKEQEMYILTNQDKYYGAATIFYPNVMEQVAEAFGQNMIILPSSCHEVILTKGENVGKADIERLQVMVKKINETQVAPEDRLTNQVYIYDRDTKKIQIAQEWLLDKKKEKGVGGKLSIKEALEDKKGQIEKGRVKKANKLDIEH